MTNPEDILLHYKRVRSLLAEEIRILRKNLAEYQTTFNDPVIVNHYLDLIHSKRQDGKKYPIHLEKVSKQAQSALKALPTSLAFQRDSLLELLNLDAYLRYCN